MISIPHKMVYELGRTKAVIARAIRNHRFFRLWLESFGLKALGGR